MNIGDYIRKKDGYAFEGEIRSIFTKRDGSVRYVAELVSGGNGDGILFIFNPEQVERQDE